MTTRVSVRLLSIWFACCMLHAAALPSVPAQEVEWRLDYTKACQEAEKKNRPIVIDVGTENCYWCKQLDLRTFKDPALIVFLNERCIPLKINAEQHTQLIERLHVQNYPTLVFASPERKILGYQEGFIEAAALRERLTALFAPLDTG